PPRAGPGVAGRRLGSGPGGCRLRQRSPPPLRPRGPGHPRHRDPAEPPWARPEMAPDEVPAADGQAVPQEAARGPPPPRVWAKVASGIGVQPAQAPARELPRGSLGCRARARVPPPRTDSQPDAPCRLSIDGFNRANDTLKQLKALGNEATRAHNAKWGAGDNQFGVKHGDIRALAKKIKTNHELAMSLWETGNVDAQLLAILLIKPKDLSAEEVDRLVRSISFAHVADWLNSYVVKQHADKETLRQKWMADDDRWAARAGWGLTAERVVKSPDGLDLKALLDRIESE